jgi:hypothetical protein
MNRFAKFIVLSGVILLLTLSLAVVYAAKDTQSPGPPPVMNPNTEVSKPSTLQGKVVETMNSGGYTYVLLEKKGAKTWVAIPQMEVSVGQQLSLQYGQEMRNFMSKSLGRSFDSIIFSGGPVSAAQPAGKIKKGSSAGMGSKAAAPSRAKNIKVEKATGANAYTIGEIYEKRTALHEKTATVKGQVVKVAAGIMGKNWIHLQDGTGDVAKETNDLVATSQELPEVGDVITIKGTVFIDKDFGSGYKYDVIMEKAMIQQ